MLAFFTLHPHEPMRQNPALQELVELLPDIVGETFSGNTISVGEKGRNILGDRLGRSAADSTVEYLAS